MFRASSGIERFLERYGDRFLKRILTPDEQLEIARFKVRAEQVAGRVAVKEAASKALGTGWRQGVHWKNFAVAHEPSGKPKLVCSGRALEINGANGRERHARFDHARWRRRGGGGDFRELKFRKTNPKRKRRG